jgi:hypothetical protein
MLGKAWVAGLDSGFPSVGERDFRGGSIVPDRETNDAARRVAGHEEGRS